MNILLQNYLFRGFWGDEAWTALISSQSIKDLIGITSQDFHPPFYYILVHLWGQFFGFSEVTIRLMSLLFYILAFISSYFLVKALKIKKLQANLVTILIALSPIFFLYAFEARNYALLFFLSAISALAFWKAREEKGYHWRILYFFTGVAAMYTHYYAWFILFSHAFYLLLFERDKIRKLFLTYLAMGLSLLPWIPTFLSQIGQVEQSYWIAPINSSTHWEMLVRVISGDSLDKIHRLAAKGFLLVLITGFLSKLLFAKSKKKAKAESLKPFYFLAIWIFIPILIPTLISLKTPIFFYRYLLFLVIPLVILFVWALAQFKRWLGILLYLFFALTFLLFDYQTFSKRPYSMREEYQKVRSEALTLGKVYTVLPSFAEVMYYSGSDVAVVVKPEGLVQFSGKSLLDYFASKGQVEIVEPQEGEARVELLPGPTSEVIESSK